MNFTRYAALVVATLGCGSLSHFCYAATAKDVEYPTRPVRMIVPYAVGGSTDVLSRIVAQRLTEKLATQFVVDNRPGANGIIGTDMGARASADGHTILMASSGHTANPALHRNLQHDVIKDFASVVHVASMPNLLATSPSQPLQSLKDVVAFAKVKPGALSFAHAGVGSAQQFAGEMLKTAANINMVGIAYSGGGPATIAALGGQVPLLFAGLPPVIPHVKSGKLRGLAVTSLKRSPFVPEIPAIAESYLGFDNVFWVAIVMPRGVPREVIAKLNSEVNAVLTRQDTVADFAKQGVEPGGGTPEALDAFIRKELQTAAAIVKQAGIKAE